MVINILNKLNKIVYKCGKISTLSFNLSKQWTKRKNSHQSQKSLKRWARVKKMLTNSRIFSRARPWFQENSIPTAISFPRRTRPRSEWFQSIVNFITPYVKIEVRKYFFSANLLKKWEIWSPPLVVYVRKAKIGKRKEETRRLSFRIEY